jgi:hypothetical protein
MPTIPGRKARGAVTVPGVPQPLFLLGCCVVPMVLGTNCVTTEKRVSVDHALGRRVHLINESKSAPAYTPLLHLPYSVTSQVLAIGYPPKASNPSTQGL